MEDVTMDYEDGISMHYQDDAPPIDYLNDQFDLPVTPAMDGPQPEHDNIRSTTLRDFCRRAKDLLNLDSTAFVRYVLTGKDTDGSQACIDPILNRITHEDSLNFIRDYDSLLGFSSHVRLKTSLDVYPVPKNEDTLSRNIHIRHRFAIANVGFCLHIFYHHSHVVSGIP
jgi:hypothetical protein